eukprot:1185316-Prorocentrum_minimum.AAC.2
MVYSCVPAGSRCLGTGSTRLLRGYRRLPHPPCPRSDLLRLRYLPPPACPGPGACAASASTPSLPPASCSRHASGCAQSPSRAAAGPPGTAPYPQGSTAFC